MDAQSIMAALGSGEGEMVSEESALFEYSRSIIRTRAAEVVWLSPATRTASSTREINVLTRRKKTTCEGLSEFYHLGDQRNGGMECDVWLLWRFLCFYLIF